MALLDFLKKKQSIQKAAPRAKAKKPMAAKSEPVLATPASEASEKKAVKASATSNKTFSYDVVRQPHISEKATLLAEHNKYVFTVDPQSNKPEIKKAIEGIYNVNVVAVHVISIPHKKRRLGRTEGFKKAYTKAIVTIKEGQKIEIF